MTIRTTCSAISCVVALTLALPGEAEPTPADVRGASSNSTAAMVPTTLLSYNHAGETSKNASQKVRGFANTESAPPMHIEELTASRIGSPNGKHEIRYDIDYLTQFQEALTSQLSAELDQQIEGLEW